jgi:hypothetical protein
MSQRLESAMSRAQINSATLAAAVGVDAKTVNRWPAGRVSHKRTRADVARVLHESESTL